jgi:hypothetical protein
VKRQTYKVTVRIEVSEDQQRYSPAGLATVLERRIEADSLLGIAQAIDPIIKAAETVGTKMVYQ